MQYGQSCVPNLSKKIIFYLLEECQESKNEMSNNIFYKTETSHMNTIQTDVDVKNITMFFHCWYIPNCA